MKHPVQALLASAARLPDCIARRSAWVDQAGTACLEAQQRMDERCTGPVDRLCEEEFERLFEEEQAKVDALRRPLQTAAERDLWPRELYLRGL